MWSFFLRRRESLHHCTGIQAAVMCEAGTVSLARWLKHEEPPAAHTPSSPPLPAPASPAEVNRLTCFSPDSSSNVSSPLSPPTSNLPFQSIEEILGASKPEGDDSVPYLDSSRTDLSQPTAEVVGRNWRAVVESLNPERDVLLFPGDDAILAEEFPWTYTSLEAAGLHAADSHCGESQKNLLQDADAVPEGAEPSQQQEPDQQQQQKEQQQQQQQQEEQSLVRQTRWRLVVLEASWTYGKGMARQIVQHRARCGLPPIRLVALSGIVGQYWKFQEVGQSALSTIEAIAAAAGAAGLGADEIQALLVLFRLQKFRVLQRVNDSGKVPKGIDVRGCGLGSWEELTAAIDDV